MTHIKHSIKGSGQSGLLIIMVVSVAIAAGAIAFLRMDTTGQKGSGLSPEFDYDLSKQRQIDPALIVCRELTTFTTGLTKPRSIAIGPEDQMYIGGTDSIQILDKKGSRISQITLNGVVTCLAVAPDGRVYAGLKDHIEVYDINGKKLSQWETPDEKAVLSSLAVYKDNLFVADAGNRIVYRYDLKGHLINLIGAKDENRNIPGFVIPSPYFDLAVTSDGLLRVVNPGNHRIEAYTFEGDLEFSWGEFSTDIKGFCGCCNPSNFAVMPDDSFVTCEKGITRVKLYNAEGGFTGVVAGPDSFLKHDQVCNEQSADCSIGGLDVAVDSTGRILVLDPYLSQIRVFVKH
ncbi:MAG: NHL repeat-containing protein [Sedimentisphaerales bacterium]|nr:NHL repeat-containing protein [Sedimentisphaerales bacterium]